MNTSLTGGITTVLTGDIVAVGPVEGVVRAVRAEAVPARLGPDVKDTTRVVKDTTNHVYK